jgi:hypothetical protein
MESMKKRYKTILILAIVILITIKTASAFIVYLRPPKMIIHLNTSDTVERSLTIENRNNISMTISATINGNISDVITIKNPSFEILPDETKTIDFVTNAKNPGNYIGQIIVTYDAGENKPINVPADINVMVDNPNIEVQIEVADKTIDYINKYLLNGQGTATLVSVEEKDGLYNIKFSISGRQYDSYVTMDGKLLFPSAIEISEMPENPTLEEVSNKTIDYINKYLLSGQATANLTSVQEVNGLYNLKFTISGRAYDSYITKDGSLLFPSAVDMTQTPQVTTTVPATFEPQKTDKPVAQLYVMSFCPYGIQAETGMKPVVDLLGSKASIEPHFIVSISGDTVSSLHGDYEAKEDMRQACIWKNYGQAIFWNYVDYINKNCNSGNIDTCWKDAAKAAKVDVTKIDSCSKTEGLTLMKAEAALSNKNGVSGSPTLIINGATYNGDRTPEAYKQAICSAFITPPSECGSTTTTSPVTTTLLQTITSTTTPSVDKTKILEILILLEQNRIDFDQLKDASQSIEKYYESVGKTDKANCWKNVVNMFDQAIKEIDNIKSEINKVKDNPTQDDMNRIKDMVSELRNHVDKIIDKILECV